MLRTLMSSASRCVPESEIDGPELYKPDAYIVSQPTTLKAPAARICQKCMKIGIRDLQ